VGTGKTDLRVNVGSKLLYFFSPRKSSADRLTALSTRLANYSLFVELNSFSFGSMQSFEKEICLLKLEHNRWVIRAKEIYLTKGVCFEFLTSGFNTHKKLILYIKNSRN
jgi:hypothetical protein